MHAGLHAGYTTDTSSCLPVMRNVTQFHSFLLSPAVVLPLCPQHVGDASCTPGWQKSVHSPNGGGQKPLAPRRDLFDQAPKHISLLDYFLP